MANEKIMYMTDHSTTTGFGVVADNVCSGLARRGYDVYLLGWGFRYETAIKRNGYTLLPTANHPFGADALGSMLAQIKPEVLITQADSRMLGGDGDNWIMNVLNSVPNRPKWIYYPVVDSHVWDVENAQKKWPSNWTKFMSQADRVVGMAKFAQDALKFNGIEAGAIHHGIDTGLFRPLPENAKEDIKKQIGCQGKFVLGGVFKNMGRKNPEKYLQTLAIAKKKLGDKGKDMVLFLHTNPVPQAGGEFNLVQQATDYGLTVGKDVVFGQLGIPYAQMPLIYNAMDVFLSLGGMEGFNLPLIEAMGCGIPVIASDCTTHPELLGDTGLLVKNAYYSGTDEQVPVTFGSYNGVECYVPDPYDASKKVLSLFADRSLRERLGFETSTRAVRLFDWKVIVDQWEAEIKKQFFDPSALPPELKEIWESTNK